MNQRPAQFIILLLGMLAIYTPTIIHAAVSQNFSDKDFNKNFITNRGYNPNKPRAKLSALQIIALYGKVQWFDDLMAKKSADHKPPGTRKAGIADWVMHKRVQINFDQRGDDDQYESPLLIAAAQLSSSDKRREDATVPRESNDHRETTAPKESPSSSKKPQPHSKIGHLQVIQRLLEHGAESAYRDQNEQVVTHHLISSLRELRDYEDKEVEEMVPLYRNIIRLIEAQDSEISPSMNAARAGDGMTPLTMAIDIMADSAFERRSLPTTQTILDLYTYVITTLISKDESKSPEAPSSPGSSPLYLHQLLYRLEDIEFEQLDKDEINRKKIPPILATYEALVRALSHLADESIAGNNKALHIAAQRLFKSVDHKVTVLTETYCRIIEILAAETDAINAQNKSKNTPLHIVAYAARKMALQKDLRYERIKLTKTTLIENHNANNKMANELGETVLMISELTTKLQAAKQSADDEFQKHHKRVPTTAIAPSWHQEDISPDSIQPTRSYSGYIYLLMIAGLVIIVSYVKYFKNSKRRKRRKRVSRR